MHSFLKGALQRAGVDAGSLVSSELATRCHDPEMQPGISLVGIDSKSSLCSGWVNESSVLAHIQPDPENECRLLEDARVIHAREEASRFSWASDNTFYKDPWFFGCKTEYQDSTDPLWFLDVVTGLETQFDNEWMQDQTSLAYDLWISESTTDYSFKLPFPIASGGRETVRHIELARCRCGRFLDEGACWKSGLTPDNCNLEHQDTPKISRITGETC